MFSPLLNILTEYGGAVLAGIVTGLICKAYFATQMQGKIREYQQDLLKSHSKILSLEAENDQLQKRLKQVEISFAKDGIVLN